MGVGSVSLGILRSPSRRLVRSCTASGALAPYNFAICCYGLLYTLCFMFFPVLHDASQLSSDNASAEAIVFAVVLAARTPSQSSRCLPLLDLDGRFMITDRNAIRGRYAELRRTVLLALARRYFETVRRRRLGGMVKEEALSSEEEEEASAKPHGREKVTPRGSVATALAAPSSPPGIILTPRACVKERPPLPRRLPQRVKASPSPSPLPRRRASTCTLRSRSPKFSISRSRSPLRRRYYLSRP